MSLTVIKEEAEEQIPEEYSEVILRLQEQIQETLSKAKIFEERLRVLQNSESKIKEMTVSLQSKNTEIFALERKVKDLNSKSEEKDKQIDSMMGMVKDFKQLVESEDKAVQTDKIVRRGSEDIGKKELLKRSEVLEAKNGNEVPPQTKGGYVPLFMRRLRE